MKKTISLLTGLLVICAASVCFADKSNESTARVFVKVDPDIAVSTLTANVDMGSIQRGKINGNVAFRVDANQQYVQLSVAASPLYKADNPTYNGPDAVAPIQLSSKATIAPESATSAGASSVSVDLNQIGTIGAFPSLGCAPVTFESPQNGHFSQTVNTSFTWDQDQVEKPSGDYSGKVKLVAALMPSVY